MCPLMEHMGSLIGTNKWETADLLPNITKKELWRFEDFRDWIAAVDEDDP